MFPRPLPWLFVDRRTLGLLLASSTVITSQLPTKKWHEALSDPTLADAICDRVVHNAHVLALRGPSIRERNGMNESKEKTTEPNDNN
jgi:IstB-like ATP binding protein